MLTAQTQISWLYITMLSKFGVTIYADHIPFSIARYPA